VRDICEQALAQDGETSLAGEVHDERAAAQKCAEHEETDEQSLPGELCVERGEE